MSIVEVESRSRPASFDLANKVALPLRASAVWILRFAATAGIVPRMAFAPIYASTE